jgi:ribosomal protein L10
MGASRADKELYFNKLKELLNAYRMFFFLHPDLKWFSLTPF